MRIAITGATGFIGGHLAQSLACDGHEVLAIARSAPGHSHRAWTSRSGFIVKDLSNPNTLASVFAGCDAVAHCAGINRELGAQTYQRVHIEGTENVVTAARRAGVRKIVLTSFLRARPDCASAYHESKFAAEEIVRNSGLRFTILRPGVVYGRGDHMLDHLSHALHTFPFFALVGLQDQYVRPLAIEDLVTVMRASLVQGRLPNQTVAVLGPEQLYLREAVRRVADVVGKAPYYLRAPVWFHYALAQLCESTMKVPMVSRAQVRILSEGIIESTLPCDQLPYDLAPTRAFTAEQIRKGLPDAGPFRLQDLRRCA